MDMTSKHIVLIKGESDGEAGELTESFFQRSSLLSYDRLEISHEKTISAVDPSFFPLLEQGVEENLQLMRQSIETLQQGGCHTLADVVELTDPYLCKVFHITAHLVDGFIGIDTVFYNIVEDSHRVSARLREEIMAAPALYRLLWVCGHFGSAEDVSLLHQ